MGGNQRENRFDTEIKKKIDGVLVVFFSEKLAQIFISIIQRTKNGKNCSNKK